MKKNIFCHYCGSRLTEKFFEGKDRPFCETCDEPVYENPVPATAVVVTDSHNKVLLVKRSVDPKKGMWCLPGGFVELGETPEKGALRELREETGLSGAIDTLLGITASDSPRYNTVFMVGYHVNNCSGKLTAGDDASDAGYFSFEDLPEIAFDSHSHFIRIYYSGFAEP